MTTTHLETTSIAAFKVLGAQLALYFDKSRRIRSIPLAALGVMKTSSLGPMRTTSPAHIC